MQISEIENYIDYILKAALSKCGDLHDAEDLTQETVMAAVSYLSSGKDINKPKSWLYSVMNRKYHDMLRRKYNLPTVVISEDFDIADESDPYETVDKSDTDMEEAIRRAIGYLSSLYRSIITRYYFYGESLTKISDDLNIPLGTVKSRLSFARNEIRRGLDRMEKYIENSYMPQKLYVRNSGCSGINDEPMSLVPNDDVLSQNLLILAYHEPVTVIELAKAIGIPAAYIEPVIEKLLAGELMKRTGDGRIYTDFIIYDPEDWIKYVRDQEQFAEDNFDTFGAPVRKAQEQLRATDFFSERLERFMIINIAANALWNALQPHIKPQIFPERPNGGAWIAFGSRYPDNYSVPEDKKGKEEYGMSGLRYTTVDEYLGSKKLQLLNYETSLYLYGHAKYDGFGYSNFGEMEFDLLKLFYLIKNNISPETVGFTPKMLKNIPLMLERGMIKMNEGKLELLIPCLTHKQYEAFCRISHSAADEAVAVLKEPVGEYIRARKKAIPSHLKSVPEQKLTMPYGPSAMTFVYQAVYKGIIKRDLGYPCPETVVIID